ncbi:MAG: hypothetical protein A2Y24_06435 [Clostridiales bacterium GWE2_32_10]|nr:MAG: hypothetical protein A2Y24_06435 [Clostridiales bacterium GWE2_32_10]HBY20852.1 IS21 family transposase [Clostridiales bacterium]
MIRLDIKLDILRGYTVEGKSKRQLAREYGISKNTVKKYIADFEDSKNKLITEGVDVPQDKLIEIMVEKPKYDSSNRTSRVMTGEIIDKLKEFIAENERKVSMGIKKQCMNKQSMYEALINEGYKVSYCSVNNYANALMCKGKEAFIKQTYELGEICEFDWGEVKLEIAGKIRSYRMAVFTSAKSNYRYAILYRREQMQHFLDAHVKFFEHIGGVYKTVVYDNMKVAVAKFVGRHEKEATKELKKIALYYGFNYRFCNVRRGNEKGHVEKSVDYVRQKAFSGNIKFNSDEEANEYLLSVLTEINDMPKKYLEDKSPKEVLCDEKEYLTNLLPTYDIAKDTELRVDKYSTVIIEGNRYSVPDMLVGKFVFVKIYTDKIYCYYNKKEVAVHERKYGLQEWTMTIEHYKTTLLRKPGALGGSLALEQMNDRLKNIFVNHYKDAHKDFIHLINLIANTSLEQVYKAIDELREKRIKVNTSNIKVLVNNTQTNEYYTTKTDKVNNEIEKNSREALNKYASFINNQTRYEEVSSE